MAFNPFSRRQSGQNNAIKPPFVGYDWESAVTALEKTPRMSDRAFADAMGEHSWSNQLCDDVKKVHRYRNVAMREIERRVQARQVEDEQRKGREERIADGTLTEEQDERTTKRSFFAGLFGRGEKKSKNEKQQPTGPALPVPQGDTNVAAPSGIEPGKLNLVNYTPEQLMQHVDQTLRHVHLGMPWPIWFKWQVGELWSIAGPICLFLGTAGEVFYFIWGNTSTEDQKAWWVALSVLITVCVLEFTFMVVSYQSDTIRNHMKTKPEGPTDEDKKDLLNHKIFWFLLAIGVAIGQVSFLVVAMQAKMGSNLPFLVAFSVGRSAFTLAGDFYSAFVHKEKPSSGERTKSKLKQRADLTSDLLKQKAEEVTIINNGTILLHQAHTEAEIKMDKLTTHLEIEKLQNKSQIDTMKLMQGQATMFTDLSSGIVRALFDPKMADQDRVKLLGTMQALMGASALLPPPQGHTEVTEEKGL